MVPFLKKEKKLGSYPSVTADSGYESEEGYTVWDRNLWCPILFTHTREAGKTGASKSIHYGEVSGQNMGYHETTDPGDGAGRAGRRLLLTRLFMEQVQLEIKSGYKSEVTVYGIRGDYPGMASLQSPGLQYGEQTGLSEYRRVARTKASGSRIRFYCDRPLGVWNRMIS